MNGFDPAETLAMQEYIAATEGTTCFPFPLDNSALIGPGKRNAGVKHADDHPMPAKKKLHVEKIRLDSDSSRSLRIHHEC